MKKRKKILLIVLCFLGFCVISLTAMYIYSYYNPPHKDEFKEHKAAYVTIAELCNEHNKQSGEARSTLVINQDEDGNYRLGCFSDNSSGIVYYTLTFYEQEAAREIEANFRLKKKTLDCIRVGNGFVAFCIENGAASFIYSESGKKPDFVNFPGDEAYIIGKLDDNWYYTSKQTFYP